MSREKQADEIFCRSCGEPIKKEAEICPECGVRNKAQEKSDNKSGNKSGSTRTIKHDPSEHSTTVSENWKYAVAGAIAGWVLLFLLSSVSPAGSEVSTFVGFLGLVSWVLMPVALYFDTDYVRANAEWDPSTGIWVLVSLVPLVNIIGGCAYLYRRYEVLG